MLISLPPTERDKKTVTKTLQWTQWTWQKEEKQTQSSRKESKYTKMYIHNKHKHICLSGCLTITKTQCTSPLIPDLQYNTLSTNSKTDSAPDNIHTEMQPHCFCAGNVYSCKFHFMYSTKGWQGLPIRKSCDLKILLNVVFWKVAKCQMTVLIWSVWLFTVAAITAANCRHCYWIFSYRREMVVSNKVATIIQMCLLNSYWITASLGEIKTH